MGCWRGDRQALLVAVRSRVPPELRHGPFVVSEARAVGLEWRNLQSQAWRRISRGQYVWSALREDIELELRAVADRLPSEYAFSGATAAWLHGLNMDPVDPIEATVPRALPVRARAGLRLRRASLHEEDVVVYRGFRSTSPMRTVCDLASRRDRVESVVAIDMSLHAGLVQTAELAREVDRRIGTKGVRLLRRAVSLADARAESPMETRVRVQLVAARLPVPAVQAELHDAHGQFLARVDLLYADERLVIEFDGQNHRDRLAADLKRQNALINAGYHVLRFTASDVWTPGAIPAAVRRALDRLGRKAR